MRNKTTISQMQPRVQDIIAQIDSEERLRITLLRSLRSQKQ